MGNDSSFLVPFRKMRERSRGKASRMIDSTLQRQVVVDRRNGEAYGGRGEHGGRSRPWGLGLIRWMGGGIFDL
jgi:hypothetical protein